MMLVSDGGQTGEGRGFQPVVIVPAYNHAPRLRGVLDSLKPLGLPIIVVNDGSTDGTREMLDAWAAGQPSGQVAVVHHEHNAGKAAALHSGFGAAIARGMTHAVTIDADGEHEASDIPRLLEQAMLHPLSLVIGRRGDAPRDAKRTDTLRRAVNLAIYLECGVRLADSQCGLRVYPMKLVESLPVRSRRFAYEMEVITRAVWAGAEVLQVPVASRPPGEGTSHYTRRGDTVAAIWLHLWLLLLALAPWHKRRWPAPPEVKKLSFMRTAAAWLNPMRAVRELVDDRVGAGEVAAAVAAGVFIACTPLPLLQTALILYVAGRLHLNPMIALAASFISTPPLAVVIWGGEIVLGHLMLSLEWPDLNDYNVHAMSWSELAGRTSLEWLAGSMVLGTLLAGVSFLAAVWAVRSVRRRRVSSDSAVAQASSGTAV